MVRVNLQGEEWSFITDNLMPEFRKLYTAWNEEYSSQERDLGARAEFVNMWRKAKRVKAVVWDNEDDSSWREGLRVILFEIIAHCFLMIFDLDKQQQGQQEPPPPSMREEDGPALVPNCGHIRCIEHTPVRISVLGTAAAERYLQELREAQNGHAPPYGKELEEH